MAKRRKAKKTSRRRRVGAINANNPLVKYGSIAAGYFLGDKINDAIEKATGDKVDGKIIAAAEAGLGLFLMFKKGKKKPALQIVAGVLAGAGIKKGLQEFGVINGFSDVPVISGYRQVPALNGYNPTPGAMLGGYKVPNTYQAVMGGINEDASGSGINPTDR